MKKQPTAFGSVVKNARKAAGLTRGDLSKKIGISPRYLAGIENEGFTPSYDTMVEIITKLGIDANRIFYPDNPATSNEHERLNRILQRCDSHQLSVIAATAEALLEKDLTRTQI